MLEQYILHKYEFYFNKAFATHLEDHPLGKLYNNLTTRLGLNETSCKKVFCILFNVTLVARYLTTCLWLNKLSSIQGRIGRAKASRAEGQELDFQLSQTIDLQN